MFPARGDPHGELKGQNVLTRLVGKDADKIAEEEFGITAKEAEEIVEECRRVLNFKFELKALPVRKKTSKLFNLKFELKALPFREKKSKLV